MKVKYSCSQCCIHDREVVVTPRERGQEINAWVDSVIYSVGMDHHDYSPECRATSLQELKIPLPKDGEYIGQEYKN